MIQVTLNANEFNHSGVHNDREYTSLRVDRTSNGRVYFTTINNGIRLSTMAKQMQLVDGVVIISFGKKDKLIIGTYVDTEAEEQTQKVVEEVEKMSTHSLDLDKCLRVILCEAGSEFLVQHYNLTAEELNNSFNEHVSMIKNKLEVLSEKEIVGFIELNCTLESLDSNSINELYLKESIEEETITFTASKSLHGFGQSVWINDNRDTNKTMTYFNPKGNESITIPVHPNNYDLYWEIEQYIQSIMKEHGKDTNFWTTLINKLNDKYITTQSTDKSNVYNSNKTPSKPKPTITDSIPETHMLADYANILIDNNKVLIIYTNDNQEAVTTFKYRKAWSMRKYIDHVFNNSNIKPSWEFKYGWEYIS